MKEHSMNLKRILLIALAVLALGLASIEVIAGASGGKTEVSAPATPRYSVSGGARGGINE
jgi:hypothetical protein